MARRVIVIGSGVAGVSACLRIFEECPGTQISLVSHQSRMAPSNDQSKIVRADYANLERMMEAQRAQKAWKKGSFASHCIERGRIVAYAEHDKTLQSIDKNREDLGLRPRPRGNKAFFETFFGPSHAPDDFIYVHNSDDAVVDWMPCMVKHEQKARDICHQTQGRVYETEVMSLQHDGNRVTAAIFANGDRIDTSGCDIVLAVGSWTMEVLQKSEIELPPQHRVPVPTGLFAFELELNDEQVEFFKDKPVFSHVGRAEFVPPIREGRTAKLTWVEPFTVSQIRDVSTSALAHRVLENAAGWARQMLPRLQGARVRAIRFYCDGVTETQAPLITRHPGIENLILACGGSYTRAKDLPTDGGYVARLLNEEGGPERFTWKGATSTEQDQPLLVGRTNFECLEEQAQKELGDRFPLCIVI
ncbi:hypothetical protein N657DRAFT_637284 [Parathielavia appendiculata]|uniref:FAD dependent oxidoreductase domain-containing protein n=1 Tax=Parathielavia appendiculata TaxID=2587402 RepID=A0AAN6TSY7_9PEZI|nr:hypothetical protein N657DRAFT_637284 [Parathielavia appendiculata]